MSTVSKSNALIRLTDAELEAGLDKQSEHVIFSYNDVLGEMNRRATNRVQRTLAIATVASTVLSGLLVAVTVMRGA